MPNAYLYQVVAITWLRIDQTLPIAVKTRGLVDPLFTSRAMLQWVFAVQINHEDCGPLVASFTNAIPVRFHVAKIEFTKRPLLWL